MGGNVCSAVGKVQKQKKINKCCCTQWTSVNSTARLTAREDKSQVHLGLLASQPVNIALKSLSEDNMNIEHLGLDVLVLLPMQLQLKTTLIWWPYPGPCSWKWIRWPWVESALVHLVKRSSSPVPWPYHAPTWYDGRIDAGKKLWLDLLLRRWEWVWRGFLWRGVFMTFFGDFFTKGIVEVPHFWNRPNVNFHMVVPWIWAPIPNTQ